MIRQLIPFSEELHPRLPTIVGNVDYQTLRLRLEQIDQILRQSGLEAHFVLHALDGWKLADNDNVSAKQQLNFQIRSRRALRCTLLCTLLQEDYRGFSCQLAGNPLYQWFCLVDAIDQVRVPSKSELHRFAHWLPANQMRAIMDQLLKTATQNPKSLGWTQSLDLEAYFLDTTCLKANIHFPVDWVLLRDGVRTLMKATLLIRQAGLCGRMASPESFLKQMNRLCMAMTQQTRRVGCKKERKRILRQMKKLTKVVKAHAQRHRDLLDQQWQQTELTRGQADQILRRIDGVLTLLPKAVKQAHERIIGGRRVANDQKILSLYEPDVQVIVRGKAGADVEFGNTVLLGENGQGIILDCQLFEESAPADSQLVFDSLTRVKQATGRSVGAVGTDRGFSSADNSQKLKEEGIFDGMCPRNPSQLRRRMRGAKFVKLQRRRAQTEGRISILKNVYLGQPMRAKGFEHRELALLWGVLTHNIWRFAKLSKIKGKPKPKRARF